MENEKKFHIYSLSFHTQNSDHDGWSNCYLFQNNMEVKLVDIAKCKLDIRNIRDISDVGSSVMVSCSYLGYMGKDEFGYKESK